MVISEATRSKIEEAISKYPKKRGALLPALHLVQQDHGHVSNECAVELAEIFEIRPVEVMEVVTFYNMFFDSPQARHHVYLCTNLPCSLRGAPRAARAACAPSRAAAPGCRRRSGRC